MRRVRGRERGAATLEMVGGIGVAALLVVALVVVAPGSQLGGVLKTAVCTVKTMAHCAAEPAGTGTGTTTTAGTTTAGTGQPGGTAQDPDTGDRRDQEGQTRDDRRGRGSDKSPDDPTVGSGPSSDDPLGPGVPGTSVPEPTPPESPKPDKGAGEYDSQTAWPWDHAKKVAVEAAANLLAGKWPDAARNLSHYLANTGEPLEQDVNKILADVPLFQAQVDARRTALGEDAVARARAAGVTGPVTYPVNTPWTGYYISSDQSQNWFYALGGVNYNQTGQVTVYPPTSPGGAWRYETSTRVNLVDQYNWDGGKSTEIGPFTVTDEELARLHRQGLAREYRNQGSSDTTTSEGTVP